MYDFAKANMTHLSNVHLDYFKKWIKWIYSEWSEDQARKGGISDLWRKSVELRESEGLCAPNLVLLSQNKTSQDDSGILITFQSASEISETVFSPGNMCLISTSTKFGLLLVPIIECSANTITVRSDRMIEPDGMYHLDIYNSLSTYPTTLGNLVLLMENDEASSRLRSLIIDLAPPLPISSFPCGLPSSVQQILSDSVSSEELNDEQKDAVQAALMCNDYILIEGFPGTGKTSTIVLILRCLIEMNKSVLLTANTHSALDNVLIKMRKHVDDSKILRVGKSTSAHEAVADLTLKSKLLNVDGDKCRATRNILEHTPLVASTCHYLPRELLFSWRKFDYCIVDEASMVLEPVTFLALNSSRRYVLVGDAHQLSPLVQNKKCAKEGMSVSLFERLQVHKSALHSLTLQYRMNSGIAKLSSELFYDNRLTCGNTKVAEACLQHLDGFKPSSSEGAWKTIESGHIEDAVVFVDTCSLKKSALPPTYNSTGSIQNIGEARIVCNIVSRFIAIGVAPSNIGVMCVYRKQVDLIKSLINSTKDVEVSSIDQFQGRDKSVVIWSLVWTSSCGKRCELLNDRRRINVALTRAKHKLVIVGCAESMRSIDIMKRVVDKAIVVEL